MLDILVEGRRLSSYGDTIKNIKGRKKIKEILKQKYKKKITERQNLKKDLLIIKNSRILLKRIGD